MNVTSAVTIQFYHDLALIVFERDRITEAQLIAEIGDLLQGAVDRFQRPSLVLDLSKVTAMSSQMLGKLVAIHKAVGQAKGRLALCALNPQLKPLFKVTKLDRLFDIRADPQKVLVEFRNKKA